MSKQISAHDARRQSLVEQDASNSLAPRVKRFYEEVRFTDLKRKKVWKSPENEQKLQGEADQPSGVAGSAPAVKEAAFGSGGSSNRIRPIDVDVLPFAKKFSEKPVPKFLEKFVRELAKLDGFQIELLTKDEEDGWTQIYVWHDPEIGAFATTKITVFRLKNKHLAASLIGIREDKSDEFAYRLGDVGGYFSPYSLPYELTTVLFSSKHKITKLKTIVEWQLN